MRRIGSRSFLLWTALRQKPASERFLIETRDATLEARAVVIATGPFHRAKTPALSADLPADICQLHASTYRNPEQLAPGSVLIVGAGASGCQIAEGLYQCGRTVYFSVSRHRRILRRYRGQDLLSWLMAMGRVDQTRDSLPDGKVAPPFTLSGVGGGREIDLRRFAADGVVLLGYLRLARARSALPREGPKRVRQCLCSNDEGTSWSASGTVRRRVLHASRKDCGA